MKYFLLSISALSLILSSCETPQQEDAERLCGCFTEMHVATRHNRTEQIDHLADSCNTLYLEIIEKLKDKPEEKEKFDAAYEQCR